MMLESVLSIYIHNLLQVYCDMESDGGGWVVFQRRMDGTEDFYRGWDDYVKGFGDLNGEFWLGLNKIHRLTKGSGVSATLRVDLKDFDGNERYAKYKSFQVLDSSRKYELSVSGYSGNAGDSLAYQNRMKFSTKDQDNDEAPKGDCATKHKGAWWYKSCHQSNLNGRYLSGAHKSYADGVEWSTFKGYHYSLKISKMKLR